MVLGVMVCTGKNLDFSKIFFTNTYNFAESSKKNEMGHVQYSCVNRHGFILMKVHIVSYNFGHFQNQNSYFAYLWTNGLQNSYSDEQGHN